MQRRVRGVEGHVQEHRLGLVPGSDLIERFRRDQFRRISFFSQDFAVAVPVQAAKPVVSEVVHSGPEVPV